MANGHGGHRTPAHPAPVSGPGALSRRTDGKQPVMNLPDPSYGEQGDFRSIQQGAPLAQSGGSSPAPTPAGGGLPSVTPLGAPTQNPNEPVTAGAPLGPGMGPDGIGLPTPDSPADLQRLKTYLPALLEMANRPDASQSFRNYVSVLRATIAAGG